MCNNLGDTLPSLGEALRAVDIHNSKLEVECLYLSRPCFGLICRITRLENRGRIYL